MQEDTEADFFGIQYISISIKKTKYVHRPTDVGLIKNLHGFRCVTRPTGKDCKVKFQNVLFL